MVWGFTGWSLCDGNGADPFGGARVVRTLSRTAPSGLEAEILPGQSGIPHVESVSSGGSRQGDTLKPQPYLEVHGT